MSPYDDVFDDELYEEDEDTYDEYDENYYDYNYEDEDEPTIERRSND